MRKRESVDYTVTSSQIRNVEKKHRLSDDDEEIDSWGGMLTDGDGRNVRMSWAGEGQQDKSGN